MLPIILHQAAPHLPSQAIEHATQAIECQGIKAKKLLIIDMSEASSEKRLWAFDVSNPKKPVLITRSYVAHGKGSDPKDKGTPTHFSNLEGSNATSLGLYKVGNPYQGNHGQAYLLEGLTPGFNDQALARHVVLHQATYVGAGHVGRSYGCPAVSPETLQTLERAGLDGAYLWIDAKEAPSPTCSKKGETL